MIKNCMICVAEIDADENGLFICGEHLNVIVDCTAEGTDQPIAFTGYDEEPGD